MTVANALTILRLLLIPVFVNALWYGRADAAFWIFAVAGISDWLDGALARWLQQKSQLGAYLDPAADKFLLVTAYVMLAVPVIDVRYHIPVWLTTLVVARDVIIVTAAALIYMSSGNVRFRPTVLGKLSTGTQVTSIFVLLFFNMRDTEHWLPEVAIWATLATTLASGFHYMYHAGKLLEKPVLRETDTDVEDG